MKSIGNILMICCSACLLLLSCGVFSPRDIFERPADQQTIVDTYNFGALLKGTGEVFSHLDWYELFDDSLRYVNVRSGSNIYSKADLINHLNQQKVRVPGARVSWKLDDAHSVVNRITLSNVLYTVADSSATEIVLYSGSSAFEIRRDANNVWRILTWTDDPTSDTAFFSPAE